MKVTIRVETTTFETTQQGEKIDAGTVKALTSRKAASWDDAKLMLTHQSDQDEESAQTPIDETPDPLEDVNYTDVAPEVLASEELANMVPANILAAE